MQRRHFITLTALSAVPPLAADSPTLGQPKLIGKIRAEGGPSPVAGAHWYVAEANGDGIGLQFPAGTLARVKCLTADMLLDGIATAAFSIALGEGERGRTFRFSYGALNQCSFRLRLDLSLVDQRAWMVDREGAFLKPRCGGDRVDLDKVDRLTLTLSRKGPNPVRWCMTPLRGEAEMPPRISDPILPKGPLLDELGQSTLTDWPGKTRTVAELTTRVRRQYETAAAQSWPDSFSRWGGSKSRKLSDPAGFFRTRREAGRWWLTDPDGYAFWSAGIDCVRVDSDARVDGIEKALKWMPEAPEFADAIRMNDRGRRASRSVNFLAANMIRSFGRDGWRDKWAKTALAEMKRLRFNTVGNWSEWRFAAQAKFPYVIPMSFRGERSGMVFRDFPDVFHAAFEQDATDYAAPLRDTASDPALIGYFLMNEPTWAFASEVPAVGMLYNTETCATRDELARFLRKKYEGDAALARAWAVPTTFDAVARGKWRGVLSPAALADLRDFSLVMVERYFQSISKACKRADPNHLNLGMRWQGIPKDWAVPGMKFFDVFSLNCYQDKLPASTAEKIASLLGMPVLVGEWHFGALDAGLPASGIGHLKNQADRARAYRVYLEDAAADLYCVGVHWFTLYDQSALGRFDGENYNIGFLDVCNRAYEEMGHAAIASHERMYEIAAGRATPFADAPLYLPKLHL